MLTTSRAIQTPERPLESEITQDIHKIAFGGGSLALASIFGNGLSYLFGIYLARNLGPHEFGLYVVGLSFFNILTLLAPLGLEIGVVKFISEQIALGERVRAQSTLFQVMVIGIISSLFLAFFFAILVKPISLEIYKNPEMNSILLLFAVAIPLASVSNLLISSIQAFQSFRYTAVIKYFWEPLGKFLLAMLAFGTGLGLFGVIYGIIFVFGTSLIINIMTVRYVSGINLGNLPSWSNKNLRVLFLFCLPLVITNLLGIIAPRSDVLILGHWVTLREVGFYGAASQSAAMLSLIPGSFSQIFAPIIGATLAKKDRTGLKVLMHAVSRWSLLLSLPVFLFLILFAHEILSIFGKDFSQSASCLFLLASAQIFGSVTGSIHSVLNMSGNSRKIMWNTIFCSPLLIILNFLFIPVLGIMGSALAMFTISFLTGLIGGIQVWSLYRILPIRMVDILKIVLSGLLALAAALFVKSSVGLTDYGLMTGITLLAIYCTLLFLFKFNEIDLFVIKTVLARLKRREISI
jgi:O-antigen/teichoic acid export membrane protein